MGVTDGLLPVYELMIDEAGPGSSTWRVDWKEVKGDAALCGGVTGGSPPSYRQWEPQKIPGMVWEEEAG